MSKSVKVNRPDPMPLAYIEWVDSRSSDGWRLLDEIDDILEEPDRLLIQTIGWVFEDQPEYITLVSSQGAGQILSMISIPRVAIKKMTMHKNLALKRRA